MKSLEQLALAWQRVAENRISIAQQEGAFDDLPGMGRPLEEIVDLSDPYGWVRRAIRDIHEVRAQETAPASVTKTGPSRASEDAS